jgi:hypothetical protein
MTDRRPMNAEFVPLRPRIQETFVCPCGSQWFVFRKRMSVDGNTLETAPVAHCEGCDRKHHVTTKGAR